MEHHAIWLEFCQQWAFMALPPARAHTRVVIPFAGREAQVVSILPHRYAVALVGQLEQWEVAQLFGGGN